MSQEVELSTSGRSTRSFSSTARISGRSDHSRPSDATTVEGMSASVISLPGRASRSGQPKWHRSIRFFMHSALHLASMSLRLLCLWFYFRHGLRILFSMQASLGVIAVLAGLYMTSQDSDVKRWANAGSVCWYLFIWTVSFLGLGIGQWIYVKRAWARRVKFAEVLQPASEEDVESEERALFLHESPAWSSPAIGGEKMLPVALVTGPAFAMISGYAYLTIDSSPVDLDHQLLLCAAVSAIIIVTMGVLDVDVAVSAYTAQRYHFDPRQKGTLAGRIQWLYPGVHFMFRFSEVTMRTAFLIQAGIVTQSICEKTWVVAIVALVLLTIDILVSAIILRIHSPKDESWFIHITVGWLSLMANLGSLVDMPGFCYPSRLMSRWLECWRFTQLATLVAVLASGAPQGATTQVFNFTIHEYKLQLGDGTAAMVVASLLYFVLRCSPAIARRHGDLHVAVWRGRKDRVDKLLDAVRAGSAGEALDVNGRTKDGLEVTPAMLAAAGGRVEILEVLLNRGARVDDRDRMAWTCLHHAAANVHIAALQLLVRTGRGQKVLRRCHAELLSLANRKSMRLREEEQFELIDMLKPRRLHIEEDRGVRSVRAPFVSGQRLGGLFPDVRDAEDAPSLRELQSVSGLLVAHAIGPLARPLLLRSKPAADDPDQTSPTGPMSIDRLRRKRLLGQGASGTVIEVEVKEESQQVGAISRVFSARTSVMSTSSSATDQLSRSDGTANPRRFALKLQMKSSCRQAYSELVALQRASHPFIVRLEHAFQTQQHFALLLEYCPGGDVNRLLCSLADERNPLGLQPVQCARYGGQVLLALLYLHESLGIVYRDVKPENMLISTRDQAKLADFGLALHVGERRRKHLRAEGTPGFLAPELVFGDEDAEDDGHEGRLDPFKTDAYSYGVSLELMLLGKQCADFIQASDSRWLVPTSFSSQQEHFELLQRQQNMGNLSAEALDLLLCLLPHQPSKRKELRDGSVREHPFFVKSLRCKGSLEGALLGRRVAGGASLKLPK